MLGCADPVQLARQANLLVDGQRPNVPDDKVLKGYLDGEVELATGRGDLNPAVDDTILGRSIDKDCAESHVFLLCSAPSPTFGNKGLAQVSAPSLGGVSC